MKAKSLLQTKFSLAMEGLLTPVTQRPGDQRYEPLRENNGNSMAPYIRLVEEEEAFTPADAAALMKKEPFAKTVARLDKKAASEHKKDPELTERKVLSDDKQLSSRFQFVFAEMDPKKPDSLLIREKDGKLTKGSKYDLWKRRNTVPLNLPL